MNGELLFLVPIYIRSAIEHAREMQKLREQCVQAHPGIPAESIEHMLNYQTIPYDFGLIVGYIEIRKNGQDLKAYTWQLDSKRISERTRTKRFRYMGKLSDIANIDENSNESIVECFHEFFRSIPKIRPRLGRWHVDSEPVLRIIEAVNFRSLA